MSTRPEPKEDKPQGIALPTLLIASASSVAAAIFLHRIWTGGAILGAAFTPIIVTLVSESLKRPARALEARRAARARMEAGVALPGDAELAQEEPAEATERQAPEGEDRFGIWADEREERPRFRRLRGPALKAAIVTGIVAFAIGAFVLTGAEAVLGGPGGDGGDRFRLVPGSQQRSDRDEDRDTPTTTQPGSATTPQEQLEEPATPPQTVPTVPPGTPTPTQPPPGAVPTQPAPETPVPPPTVPAEPPPQ